MTCSAIHQRVGFLVLGLVGLLTLSACGSGGDEGGATAPPTGTVTGQVVSLANNLPVSGAIVKTTAGTTTTGADGKFSVSSPVGDRSVVQAEANGFAAAFPVARVTSGQTTNLRVRLIPIGVTDTVSVAAGDTVSVPNSMARVTIPPNSLIPQGGGTPAGSVTVSLTPINPAVDTNLMPGGFNGIAAGGGSVQPLESGGALAFDIRDSAGTRYDLAPGKTATIRIPLGTQSGNPPDTMPLWYFDEAAGVWQEEGTATLQRSGSNQFYEGTVTRVSYWNADLVLDTIAVSGCVKDANNQPVANALVQTEGIDYTGTAFDSTAADGTFNVAMRKSSQANLRVVEFDPQTFAVVSASNIVKVGPSAVDITLTNCLVKQPSPLTITTTALPSGTVGVAYNQTLAASGGVPGYVWSLNTGSNPLPAGLELLQAGVIVNTPTTAGTKTITIKVTDSTGATKTKAFTVEIKGVSPPTPPLPPPPSLTITTTVLPSGIVGSAYAATVEATDGTGAKSWSISSGTLPAELSINKDTGAISGTPTTVGISTFTVQVQDSGIPQRSARQQLILAIVSPGGVGGTGGGQLTVSNAPASVGETFVANSPDNDPTHNGSNVGVGWVEGDILTHLEFLIVSKSLTGSGAVAIFSFSDANGESGGWSCVDFATSGECSGLNINPSAGTAVLSNLVLTDSEKKNPPITLNGTLRFTPF